MSDDKKRKVRGNVLEIDITQKVDTPSTDIVQTDTQQEVAPKPKKRKVKKEKKEKPTKKEKEEVILEPAPLPPIKRKPY